MYQVREEHQNKCWCFSQIAFPRVRHSNYNNFKKKPEIHAELSYEQSKINLSTGWCLGLHIRIVCGCSKDLGLLETRSRGQGVTDSGGNGVGWLAVHPSEVVCIYLPDKDSPQTIVVSVPGLDVHRTLIIIRDPVPPLPTIE